MEKTVAAMSTNNLTFNILTFKHPENQCTFYFTKEKNEALSRVHQNLVPDEVIEHFGELEHYYMSFDQEIDNGLAITKCSKPKEKDQKTCFSTSILKRYYNWLIHNYFKTQGALVKPNFIQDTEIWLPNNKEISNEYNYFEKFSLKVQIGKLTTKPELLLSYEGKSKVFKKSIAGLMSEVSLESFNWLIYENNLYQYDECPDEIKRNLDQAYPVWNFDLRAALQLPTPPPDRKNKYKKFNERIEGFYKKYLNTESFKTIIPLDPRGFLPVKEAIIGSVSNQSNLLAFGNRKLHKVPIKGMSTYVPLEVSLYNRVEFFFILHEDDEAAGSKLHEYFKGTAKGFGGLYNFAKTTYSPNKDLSIKFKSKENPFPEIEKALGERDFKESTQYIGIYISPYSKYTTDKQHREVYYKVKQALLKRKITSQVIDANKLDSNNYHYSLPNIAIAILAKLDGKPWRLDTPLKNELVVGVGTFRNKDTDVQYIGSTFSFTNNGNFDRFECFRKNQTEELAGSIIRAVKEYAALNNDVERLIIHFYKNMSQKDLQPIEDGLRKLGLDIPVFIISINKTESQDIVAFDDDWQELMPLSGTFINLGKGKYLLFNNTRYYGEVHKAHEGYPFPIKLGIYCTDHEQTRNPKVVKDLIDQVYQFSRMYWKSVSQQNLPVTIKYPEMVAEIFPHFDGEEIPEFGKSNLWFL